MHSASAERGLGTDRVVKTGPVCVVSVVVIDFCMVFGGWIRYASGIGTSWIDRGFSDIKVRWSDLGTWMDWMLEFWTGNVSKNDRPTLRFLVNEAVTPNSR